ncbi:hypothetical protein C491_00475 [Natronococcus amylolyticus DSM 10524]|uniref:Uncharacterized protein n=1 Tax=Natronococcus amylolyticus DSM 10524 TaxID=1227497 RepID=L9XM62_9EURY|nr:hypothetical protein C491_00475 [Natronococcus amylolyticus DSM 10524]
MFAASNPSLGQAFVPSVSGAGSRSSIEPASEKRVSSDDVQPASADAIEAPTIERRRGRRLMSEYYFLLY